VKGAAHTVVGTGLERGNAHIEISVGGDRDDRRAGSLTAKLAADSRDVWSRDDDHVRVEHAEQPHRLLLRGDREHVVPAPRQFTPQLRLGAPVYQQDPKRLGGWPQASSGFVEHAAIVQSTCEHDVRGT
jgi:hypothetical protein